MTRLTLLALVAGALAVLALRWRRDRAIAAIADLSADGDVQPWDPYPRILTGGTNVTFSSSTAANAGLVWFDWRSERPN